MKSQSRSNGENGNNTESWKALRTAERFSALRDLCVTYEGHSENVVSRPPDVSTRGMFINTTRTFPEGAVLNVRFRLALSGSEVQSRAEVRYCLPGVGVGVEFVGISREHVHAIEHEIEIRNKLVER
jgi:PilZ domain